MRVAIVGGGVIGCAIALEARRRGFDVTIDTRFLSRLRKELASTSTVIG